MATVLHRTTNQLRESVHTPDFPVADWVINPDLINVAGTLPKYWEIIGDVVTLRPEAQRDAIDAAELVERTTDQMLSARNSIDSDRKLLGFMSVMVDEINQLRTALSMAPPRTLAQYKAQTKTRIGEQT